MDGWPPDLQGASKLEVRVLLIITYANSPLQGLATFAVGEDSTWALC